MASPAETARSSPTHLRPRPKVTYVDLSGLTAIDPAGITALLRATRRSRMVGTRLRFLRGSGQVAWVLGLCGLHDRLPFLDR